MNRLQRVFMGAVLLASVCSARASQEPERFRVSQTFQSYWSREYCRLDVDVSGGPPAPSRPARARLKCGTSTSNLVDVRDELTSAEMERFAALAGDPAVWTGQANGRDGRPGDGSVEWIERQSEHSWVSIVTSGNRDFYSSATPESPVNSVRGKFVTFLHDLQKRLRQLQRDLIESGRAGRGQQPAYVEGIDALWSGLWDAGEVPMGLKKDGNAVFGWVLVAGRPLPITNGKIEGDTLTFSLSDSNASAASFVGKLGGGQLQITRTADAVTVNMAPGRLFFLSGSDRTFIFRRTPMAQPPL